MPPAFHPTLLTSLKPSSDVAPTATGPQEPKVQINTVEWLLLSQLKSKS